MRALRELIRVPKTAGKIHARTKNRRQHVEYDIELAAETEGRFTAFVRASIELPESFSVGLIYQPDGGSARWLLRVNVSVCRR
jgi:hypothetical protein